MMMTLFFATHILELDVSELAQFRYGCMSRLGGQVDLNEAHLRRAEEGLVSCTHDGRVVSGGL